MITFTQMENQAADNCGLYSNDPAMVKVRRDINTGVKLFQNAARRYWTRGERKTDITGGQQYYQFPSDMLRVSTVKALRNDRYIPLTEVKSEDEWNKLLVTPLFGLTTPTYYFIKGADEIGIYPVPSGDITDGLLVSFEPRMVDMAIADVTPKVDLVNGSVIVTAHTPSTFSPNIINNCWLTIPGGADGNWYKVAKYIDSTHIWLDNVYQGADASDVDSLIGQCPPFPEEYHDAPVYFASHQFFLMRKDLESASMYKQLFDGLFNQYKTVYGNKTSGGVINPGQRITSSGVNSNVFPGTLLG